MEIKTSDLAYEFSQGAVLTDHHGKKVVTAGYDNVAIRSTETEEVVIISAESEEWLKATESTENMKAFCDDLFEKSRWVREATHTRETA